MQAKDWNYQESQKAILPMPVNQSAFTHARTLYVKCRDLNEISERHLQELSDAIFKMFGLQTVPVRFAGKQPVKNTRNGYVKTLGVNRRNFLTNTIQIYKLTGKRGQVRKPKASVETLLHEIVHTLDIALCKLNDSIHSAGFYKRISQLKDMLFQS